MSQGGLAQFSGEKYISIETFRKNGEAVRTPVWFVENNNLLYVRTSVDTGKYKRIRNNKNVRVAPCDMRGKVKGEWTSGEASIASDDEMQQVSPMFKKKYGLMYRMTGAFLGSKDYVIIVIKV